MIYVALLRGINVGGKNLLNMKALKETFERASMESVSTYINTGNIFFKDELHTKEEIVLLLEEAIRHDFDLEIKVLLRNLEDMTVVMNQLPDSWTNDQVMKSNVLFLWHEIDDESILEQLIIRPEVDKVIYISGVVLWSVNRENQSKSGLNRLVGTKLYQNVTIRNVNTTRKIYQRMLEIK